MGVMMRKLFFIIGVLTFFLSSCSKTLDIEVSYDTNYNYSLPNQIFENEIDIEMLPELKREGHNFEGWYLDKDFSNSVSNFKLDQNQPINELTLYAKWTLIDSYNEFQILLISYNGINGIEISGYSGDDDEITIPNFIYGYKVISIGTMSFYKKNIKTIYLNDNLLKIGLDAFQSNQLNEIYFGNQLISIEAGAFYNNQLVFIDLPDSIERIGSHAFSENKLININLPSNLIFLGSSAFADNDLVSVNINDKLQSITSYAFGWNQIKEIIIPNNIIEIGTKCF